MRKEPKGRGGKKTKNAESARDDEPKGDEKKAKVRSDESAKDEAPKGSKKKARKASRA